MTDPAADLASALEAARAALANLEHGHVAAAEECIAHTVERLERLERP